MEIYTPAKLELIRLTIKGNCQDTQSLNLINTTHAEVIEYIIKTFSGYMVKCPKFRTTIDIRHCIGGDNLNSQRVSLYGIKPFEVMKVLNFNLRTE
jgi:hypothetical protein